MISNLQTASRFNERSQVFLQDVDFSVVHVLKQHFKMARVHVLQEDDRMLVRPSSQNLPEEGRADAEHQLVSLEDLVSAGQGDVRQHLGCAEVLHYAEEAVVVVVPFQKELFLLLLSSVRIHRLTLKDFSFFCP